MKIIVGNDHRGFAVKQKLTAYIKSLGHEVIDAGSFSEEYSDYPDFAFIVAERVGAGECERGLLLCGTGTGMCIAANKVHGVRAALCCDEYTARLARQHNDANVCSLGARILGDELALAIVDLFLATPFEGGRHVARLAQVAAIEREECV